MSGAHLHLLVNHLPVIGMVGSTILLAWGLFTRSSDVRRVALVALLLTGLSAPAAFYTGEPAEDSVKHMPGVEMKRIDEHEDAAKWGLAVAVLGGVIALGGLVATRGKDVPRGLVATAFVVALFGVTVFTRVANLGGEIHHPEIRAGFVPPSAPPHGAGADSSGHGGEHDEGDRD